MRVLYAFPEPLPLPRARGVQAIHSIHALAGEIEAVDFAFEPAPGQPDPFSAYGLTRPGNVRLMPLSRRLPWPFAGLGLKSHRLFARRLVARVRRGDKPDVILVRHVKLAAALARCLPHIPLAYEAHEVFADTASPRHAERIGRIESRALGAVRLLLANSRATAERLRARYPAAAAAEVLPNGVTVPAAPPPRDWRNAGREIVYAGSLFGWKGVADLVAAAALLPGRRITIIGGETEAVARLRAAAPQGGAELVFAGRLPHAEVQRRLAASCIAVLPNRADRDSAFTSPLKLFEYLAAGCAVVATDLPAVREILGAEDAAWAAPGDPASLAAAIRSLTENPAAAEAVAARGFARVQAYSWQARARRLAGLLRERCGA